MNPLPFHVLLALAAGDVTATECWRQVRRDTEGMYWVAESSYYSALAALLKQQLIERSGSGQGAHYRITPRGRRRLQSDGARITRAVTLLRERT